MTTLVGFSASSAPISFACSRVGSSPFNFFCMASKPAHALPPVVLALGRVFPCAAGRSLSMVYPPRPVVLGALGALGAAGLAALAGALAGALGAALRAGAGLALGVAAAGALA